MQVVVVEDNTLLASSIRKVLEHEGYTVEVLHDGQRGEQIIVQNQDSIDLVILDVLLPEKDGFSVLRSIREGGVTTPVLMLTSKTKTQDVVHALAKGADDYLKKPFEMEELLARVGALLRRKESLVPQLVQLNPAIVVDLVSRMVEVNGEKVHLTPKEFGILEYLLHNKNSVVTQQNLYDHVFDFAEIENSNTMEVHLKNLRKKLQTIYDTPITTIRGVGYRLEV